MQVLRHEAPAWCSCVPEREGGQRAERKGSSRVDLDLAEVGDVIAVRRLGGCHIRNCYRVAFDGGIDI